MRRRPQLLLLLLLLQAAAAAAEASKSPPDEQNFKLHKLTINLSVLFFIAVINTERYLCDDL